MYKQIVRPAVFSFDSETVHHATLKLLRLSSWEPLRSILESIFGLDDVRLKTKAGGLEFSNPVGLAAGFDKNGLALPALAALGFGFIELGSVTGQAQAGNPRPRIFRLPADEALINRMGFPSAGAEAVRQNLAYLKSRPLKCRLGINLGKTKTVPIDQALDDYLASFRRLRDLGDYFVLNVSSPNTPELRKLQERDRLASLFRGVQAENVQSKPLWVKIAPDLNEAELDEVLACALECKVSGLIATNTTFDRSRLQTKIEEVGGLSGRPLHSRAVEIIGRIQRLTSGQLPIIGVGGIFSFADVLDFLSAGAAAVQLYSGLVYEGPGLVRKIKFDLINWMERNSVKELGQIKSGQPS